MSSFSFLTFTPRSFMEKIRRFAFWEHLQAKKAWLLFSLIFMIVSLPSGFHSLAERTHKFYKFCIEKRTV